MYYSCLAMIQYSIEQLINIKFIISELLETNAKAEDKVLLGSHCQVLFSNPGQMHQSSRAD